MSLFKVATSLQAKTRLDTAARTPKLKLLLNPPFNLHLYLLYCNHSMSQTILPIPYTNIMIRT